MRTATILLPLALLATAACAGGRGAPRIGTGDRPPTRTIAGEPVRLERYGGAWEAVASAPAGDRATLERLWQVLHEAGIPGTAVAYGAVQELRVPGPHAREARSRLRALRGRDGGDPAFEVVGR